MILDVGCGINPRGDVNLDLRIGGDYAAFQTKADINASCLNLPFRSNLFSTVYFNGLLHHIQDPFKAWSELARVCDETIVGLEPNLSLRFPRDKTEAKHGYRKGELWRIVRSSGDWQFLSVDRVFNPRPTHLLMFRITGLKKRSLAASRRENPTRRIYHQINHRSPG
jgi:hypothetical protein